MDLHPVDDIEKTGQAKWISFTAVDITQLFGERGVYSAAGDLTSRTPTYIYEDSKCG